MVDWFSIISHGFEGIVGFPSCMALGGMHLKKYILVF